MRHEVVAAWVPTGVIIAAGGAQKGHAVHGATSRRLV